MKTMTVEEFREEGLARFGENTRKWKFVCPRCKTEQSIEDLVAAGVAEEDVEKYIGFSCVGRFNNKATGCDWTLGGLFKIHTLEIDFGEGGVGPRFELAEGVPFVSFSNDEIAAKPDLKETIVCRQCGQEHPVEYGDEVLADGTKKPSKVLAYYKCGDKSYLAGIKGKEV